MCTCVESELNTWRADGVKHLFSFNGGRVSELNGEIERPKFLVTHYSGT